MKLFRRLLTSALWLILSLSAASLLAVTGAALYFAPGLPDVRQLQDFELQTPLRIFTRDGKLIGEYGAERRMLVDYDDIPEDMVQAFLAAEDSSFFEHPGVDPTSLARAALELVASGEIQSGGSTITMQVARNYLLTLDQTFTRKIREILLSLQMEQILSKQEIFELYVNKIYLGHRAYGVAAAARTYYDKPLDELSVAETAMIAGLPKAPSALNPLTDPERSLIRRNWVLYRMRGLGFIDQAAYEQAVKSPITASNHITQVDIEAPYIAEMARQFAKERFGDTAYTGGYRIHTTIDSKLQVQAREALIEGLIEYDLRHGWRGAEKTAIPPSLVEAQSQTQREGLEEELSESPEVMETARQAAESSKARVSGIDTDVSNWLKVLERTPSLGPLEPAIVVSSEGKEMEVLTRDGELITINWEGLEWAREYRSPEWRGEVPTSADQIAQRGSLVRVMRTENDGWRLSQQPGAEAAIVVLEPDTGAILALQGGFSFAGSQFNRAIQAKRQPGSNFKPFIYLAALQKGGMTAATIVNDAPVVMNDVSGDWRPNNSSNEFHGPTRLRVGLYQSRNLVTIRILQSLGIENALEFLEKFGFSAEELPHGLSLALGSASLTPLQVARGFAILANGGFKITPWYIERVERVGEEEPLMQATPNVACTSCPPEAETTRIDGETYPIAPRVLDPQALYILRDIMRDVIERGTGRAALALNRDDIVGKTGTSNDQRDAWFSGFNGELAVSVWVGKDDYSSTGEYGAQAALPIWMDFMAGALEGMPNSWPERPEGLVTARIDPQTGRRLHDDQPGGITEIFREDNLPDFQPRRIQSELEDSSGSQGTGTYEAIF